MNRIKLNQHEVLGALTAIVTAVVSVVPQWAHEKQAILAALGGVVAVGFLAVGAVRRLAETVQPLAHSHVSLSLVMERLRADIAEALEHLAAKSAPKARAKPKLAPPPPPEPPVPPAA